MYITSTLEDTWRNAFLMNPRVCHLSTVRVHNATLTYNIDVSRPPILLLFIAPSIENFHFSIFPLRKLSSLVISYRRLTNIPRPRFTDQLLYNSQLLQISQPHFCRNEISRSETEREKEKFVYIHCTFTTLTTTRKKYYTRALL